MSLVTRCPGCRTLFRVTPVQLQKRSGKVRCGRCMQTFDGFGTLAVEQIGGPSTVASTLASTEPAATV
ncbi:MAG TPA: zinc-ribbon domain-containing protein, partial [Burkholderiales bacterium]